MASPGPPGGETASALRLSPEALAEALPAALAEALPAALAEALAEALPAALAEAMPAALAEALAGSLPAAAPPSALPAEALAGSLPAAAPPSALPAAAPPSALPAALASMPPSELAAALKNSLTADDLMALVDAFIYNPWAVETFDCARCLAVVIFRPDNPDDWREGLCSTCLTPICPRCLEELPDDMRCPRCGGPSCTNCAKAFDQCAGGGHRRCNECVSNEDFGCDECDDVGEPP